MKNDKFLKIQQEVNELMTDLLVPLRNEKRVNKQAFSKLYIYLDELVQLTKGEVYINRNLAGLLFFIYTTVCVEAEHTDYTSEIFIQAAKLEDYLNRILWDGPFGKI